jgi:hypothetical protein
MLQKKISAVQDHRGIARTSGVCPIIGRSVNSWAPVFRALRALPGENKDAPAPMNAPQARLGSRSAWVAAEEVGLAELRLLTIARRCSGAGDKGRQSGPAG